MTFQLRHLGVHSLIGIDAADLYFTKPINIFIGPNWSGKSSLAASFEFIFSGTARTLKTKTSAKALLREGSKQASVVASLENGITLRRSRTSTTESFRQVHDTEEFDTLMAPFSSWNLCALAGELYVTMGDEKRKEMLFALLSDKLTVPAVVGALIDAGTGIHEAMAVEYAEHVVSSGFKKAAERAVEERRSAKRLIDDARRQLQDVPVAEIVINGTTFDLGEGSLDDARKRLDGISKERDAKHVEKGKRQAASKHLAAEPPTPFSIVDVAGDGSHYDLEAVDAKQIQEHRAELNKERDQLLVEKGKLGSTLSPAKRTELEGRLARLRNELVTQEDIANDDVQSLQLRKTDAAGFIQKYAKDRTAIEKTILMVKDSANLTIPDLGFTECPIMEGITCPVPSKTRKQFGTNLYDRRTRNLAIVKENEGKLAEIDSQTEEARREMRSVDARLEEIERAKGRLPDLNKDIRRLEEELADDSSDTKAAEIEAKLTEVETQLASADAIIAALQLYLTQREAYEKWERASKEVPAAEGTQEIDAAITALNERITTGAKFIEAAVEYRRKCEHLNALQNSIPALEEQIAAFDVLAKALAPDGIQTRLTTNSSENFQARMKRSAAFFGAKIGISEDDFLPFWNDRPYQLCSKSEQWLSRLCFQDALAFISKTPWLVIDEADILAPANKYAFSGLLQEILADYTNIFVFATEHDIAPAASVHTAIDIWNISDGQVAKLETKAAA